MAYCSIGRTSSGKEIIISTNHWKIEEFRELFEEFLNHDFFDALLATQVLIIRERRRVPIDHIWLKALESSEIWIRDNLDKTVIDELKTIMNIDSAFAARDYGNGLLYKHFRMSFPDG